MRSTPLKRCADLWRAVISMVICCLGVLSPATGRAQTEAPPQEVALSEAQLFGYIASLASPAVADVNASVDRLMAERAMANDEKTVKEIGAKIRQTQDSFAKTVGFSSYREYADVGHTFSLLYTRVETAASMPGGWQAEIDKAIAEIEANAAMSADQKKELIESMRSVAARIQQPLMPENVEIWRRLKPRIDAALDEVNRTLSTRGPK